jgi:hypothetical protein
VLEEEAIENAFSLSLSGPEPRDVERHRPSPRWRDARRRLDGPGEMIRGSGATDYPAC